MSKIDIRSKSDLKIMILIFQIKIIILIFQIKIVNTLVVGI